MALSHILDAVTASADEQIKALGDSHAKRMEDLRENVDAQIGELKNTINKRAEEERRQWKAETETRAIRERSAQMLAARREVVDEIYDETLEQMRDLPAEQVEPLFVDWTASLPTEGGTVYPAKQHDALIEKLTGERSELKIGDSINVIGGFRFESEKEERDYTFEGITRMILRPRTERAVFDLIEKQ